MSYPLKHAPSILPMMVSFAAAASLLLLKSESRSRRATVVRREPLRQRIALPPPTPPVTTIDFAAMRRRLLGLAPSTITALLGPPRAMVAIGANPAAAEDTWYYPLGRSVRGAMAIRFDRSRHATAVTFVPTPV